MAETKNEIASYLQQGLEGKFYYRMVDTVLSRDKNWVRWKAESCPTIEKAAVSAKEWEEAKDGVRKASVVRPMRDVPLGSLDLSFLSDIDPARALKKLKSSNRWVSAASAFHAWAEANTEAQIRSSRNRIAAGIDRGSGRQNPASKGRCREGGRCRGAVQPDMEGPSFGCQGSTGQVRQTRN